MSCSTRSRVGMALHRLPVQCAAKPVRQYCGSGIATRSATPGGQEPRSEEREHQRMQSPAAEPKSVPEAYDLLARLGAPPRLLAHARLVAEAAELLVAELQRRHVPIDAD